MCLRPRPQDEVERQLLIELDKKFKQQKHEQLSLEAEAPAREDDCRRGAGRSVERKVTRPVYVDRLPDEGKGEYHYFEPVYFNADLPVLPHGRVATSGPCRPPNWANPTHRNHPCWPSR